MSRGTQLGTLLTMLKAELGDSLQAGVAVADNNRYIQLLNNKQLELASYFDEAFMRVRPVVNINGGSRINTLPVNINFERPHTCEVLWNQVWTPLVYGITEEDYNNLNSLAVPPVTSDPILKWMMFPDVNQTSFEVWPIPTSAQQIMFTGQQTVTTMALTTDTALLDDLLLVLAVASQELKRRELADWENAEARFQTRLKLLRAAYPTRSPVIVPGSGNDPRFAYQSQRKRVLLG